MKLRRKLYSENNNPSFISKISKGIKNTARNVADKTKQGYNFVKTHTAKETASEVCKGVKKGSKAAWKYVKKNPDEAIVLTGSYAIPGVVAAKLLKSGKTKQAALVGSIAAFPIGEGYIAAKKGIQAVIKKNNEVKSKQKQFSQREKVPSDIAKEGRKSGVIQKDKSGKWRIISYKTNPPEFWDAHYDTREDAEKALGAYHANK